jgi:hypothetical protein
MLAVEVVVQLMQIMLEDQVVVVLDQIMDQVKLQVLLILVEVEVDHSKQLAQLAVLVSLFFQYQLYHILVQQLDLLQLQLLVVKQSLNGLLDQELTQHDDYRRTY